MGAGKMGSLGAGGGNGGGGARIGRSRLPRVNTVPGALSSDDNRGDFNNDETNSNNVTSEAPSSLASAERVIIVAHKLPLNAERNAEDTAWNFSFDKDSLLLQLKHGLSEDMEAIYIGTLKVEVDLREQDEVTATLLENFNCVPAFLSAKLTTDFYHGFLHNPFPSSEIYRTLPIRDEILRGLLNVDLIGFHMFDYARHFLSCCSRMLGLVYKSKRGYIGLEYYGRTMGIKIMPVGVHMGQLTVQLQSKATGWRARELKAEYDGKTVLLGVDNMDIFKGIGLKLLAMEQLLRQHEERRGRVVLIQIVNPPRGHVKEVQEIQTKVATIARRINRDFGREGYQPVVLLERNVPLYERIAYYTIADSCVVTPVRDRMNLIPYEYIVCRDRG